jgi:ABC-2 type transport system permease protein
LNLALTQIVFIAHMTGILWLRRNPLSMVFSALSPFSILFVLFVVSNGQYTDIAIAGSLVMATVGYGLALGQDISFYKTEYKIQDIFVASPVSSLTYMTGLALSELLFGLPALTALTLLATLLGDGLSTLPLLIFSILITWGAMSAMGFFLSSHMLHMRNATQIISFINVILAVIPPVYYSIERLPSGLQYLAYSIPTTHASLMIQDSLGLAVPENWSIYLGLTIQTAYLIGFLALARSRAVWRDL